MPKVPARVPAASAVQSPFPVYNADGPVNDRTGPMTTVNIAVREAKSALWRMGELSPEHAQFAEVVCALLDRLDTVRDEVKFRAHLATSSIDRGDSQAARVPLGNIITICGERDQAHSLSVRGLA